MKGLIKKSEKARMSYICTIISYILLRLDIINDDVINATEIIKMFIYFSLSFFSAKIIFLKGALAWLHVDEIIIIIF